MINTGLRFALRRTRLVFRSPKQWGVLVALSVLLGLSGPFNTIEFLRLWPRIAYWFSIVLLTYGTGVFAHNFVYILLPTLPERIWITRALAGVTTGIMVAIVLLLINWGGLGLYPVQRGYTFWMVANAVVISMIITFLIGLLGGDPRGEKLARSHAPKILTRLDLNKRGALVFISVKDHYVDVVTTKGTSLLLMRLSDAIGETDGIAGLQVHRSHWVAHAQVTSSKRNGDKAVLTMAGGQEIPVSRTYIKAVRDAGLLSG